MGQVYSITNKKDGKRFIGMSFDANRIIRNHFSAKDNHPLHIAIQSQKPQDFEIKIHHTVWVQEEDYKKGYRQLKDILENLKIRYKTTYEEYGYNVYILQNKLPHSKRVRMLEGIKNRYNKDRKKKGVEQYTLRGKKVAEYESILDASNKTGISRSSISNCINQKTKQVKYTDVEGTTVNYIFRLKELP